MKRHILTIAVEDYFHVAALRGAISRKHWDRLEPRLERSIDEILGLLARHDATATFFVYGRIAELSPALIRRIVDAGHEVASRGFVPVAGGYFSRHELVRDLERAEEALEAAGANRILGFRAPRWLRRGELWVLDAVAEHGYLYDSSVNPVLRRFAHRPDLHHVGLYRHPESPELTIHEFPVSTVSIAGLRVPISGGNYIRQLPHGLLSRAVRHKSRNDDRPQVFYLMPWELDPAQPHIRGISWLQRIRHYRNLGKTRWVLELYLREYAFSSIADHLGVELAPAPPRPAARVPEIEAGPALVSGRRGVTVLVPMYNEAVNIPYLRRMLLEVRRRLAGRFHTSFLLVDDASTDRTWETAHARLEGVPDVRIIRHETNRGVAGAIMTGIREADTELVCSIDCDGSYDPLELEHMIARIEHADMVTASPYHPAGAVLHVPRWRLFLSTTLSRLYNLVLGSRIHTYTSCCRVYRRSAMLRLRLRHTGFLGIAEMLIALKRAGGHVVEYPATLESRLLGESKMKVGRTILGHLGLLRDLVLRRDGDDGQREEPRTGPDELPGEPRGRGLAL